MPQHVNEKHFDIGETVELAGQPYIKGEHVLQAWDGNSFKNVGG